MMMVMMTPDKRRDPEKQLVERLKQSTFDPSCSELSPAETVTVMEMLLNTRYYHKLTVNTIEGQGLSLNLDKFDISL